MRMVNEMNVRGQAPEIDKLVEKIGEEIRFDGWKREPTVEKALQNSGIGRLGVYCYSRQSGEGKPAASLILYKRGPDELAVSSIVPAVRKPLTDEEYNEILADFKETVLRP